MPGTFWRAQYSSQIAAKGSDLDSSISASRPPLSPDFSAFLIMAAGSVSAINSALDMLRAPIVQAMIRLIEASK